MDNVQIAALLRKHARQLVKQGDNLFRIRAYRLAADSIERLHRPLGDLYQEQHREGLEKLPHIGPHLSYTLETLLSTGEFRTWDDRSRCSA